MTAFLPRVSSRKAHHGKPFARAGLAAAVIRKLHFIWVFLAVFTLMPGPTALAVVPDDIDCSEPQAAGSFAEFTCMILNGGFNFVASGEPSAQLWGGPIKPGSLQLDENGVDLGTGIFTLGAGPQISIGDPQGAGLTYAISAGAGGIGWHASLGNFNASVTKKAHGSILNGQTGTYFQVNGLLTSDTFFKPDGFTAISLTGRGATLTGLGPYVYTSSDGTVTEFSGTFSHPIFSTQIISYDQAFKVHEGQVGRIQKQTRPNGEILDYEYGVESVIPQNIVGLWTEDLTRLKFVRSNFGYTVTVDYKFNGTPNQLSEWRDWTTPINTTIKNEAVDEAGFTGVWPALTYTGNGLFELETVTDAEGGVTQYTYTGPYREYVSSIRFPGSTADDITLTYEVDPGLSVPNGPKWRVATLSRHGQTWGYSYSDSGAAGNTTGMTRTVTVTAPNNAQTVAVTKHWLIDTRYNSVGGFLQSFGRYRGQLLSVTDPLGRTTSYQYDSYDRKTRVTLPEGNYTTFTYDARGNVTETRAVAKSGSGLADIVTTATYPSTCTNTLTCNKPTSVTDALGKVTDYTYDATHGGVLTETQPDPDGAGPLARPQTRFAYTAKQAKYQNGANNWITGGSIYMLTGTSTCATGTTCNGTGDETLATNAYRASTVANNIELLSTTIAAGDGSITATTAYAYDEIGNLSAVDGPLAGTVDTTAFFYDNVRRRTGVVSPDPDGAGALKFRANRTTYNARGLPSTAELGTVTAQTASAFAAFSSLAKTTTAYDVYGRKSEARVYDGATTLAVRQFNYDVLSRLDCSARRMNPAVFASLPSSACVLGTMGSEGEDRITRTTYDVAGQLLKTISAYGTSLQQDTRTRTYSSNGQVATRKDANGNLTTYEYDGFDRLSKLRFPSKTITGTSSTTDYEAYGYDANGNVTSERRRDGQLVAITYDDLSRRSFRDAPGTASDVTYAYDNRGLQTAASVPGHASAYAFDAFGRRTQQTHDGAMPVSYAYDAASRLTRLTHPDGFAVDYAYDAAGAVISAANGATTIATVAYDALGRRSALTYGNGAVAAYGYDAASRLDALDWDVAGSADDIAYGFSYNPASQTRTKNVVPAVMLWAPPSNATDTYAVNGLNQYTDVKGNTIVHDGRGNITTDHRGRTQTYDIDNRLLTVAGLAGGTATYAYTAAGNLHQKSYSGVASKFYYDDTQEIYETDGVGVKLRRYLRLPGSTDEPLLMIDYTLNGSCTNTSYAACEVWAHQNRQGSIVATTNNTGAKLDLYTYSPYGESGTEGASGFPFRYTGQKLDPDTGLYYYKARWYDSETGRFMQTDPIGYEGGQNLYAYVSNDPINLKDPLGLHPNHTDKRTVKKQEKQVKKLKDKLKKVDDDIAKYQEQADDPSRSEGSRSGSKIRVGKLKKKRDRVERRLRTERRQLGVLRASLKARGRHRNQPDGDNMTDNQEFMCSVAGAVACLPARSPLGIAVCSSAASKGCEAADKRDTRNDEDKEND